MIKNILLCWHSVNHGLSVAENAIKKLEKKDYRIDRIIYLFQPEHFDCQVSSLSGIEVRGIEVPLTDPSDHENIYSLLKKNIIPELKRFGDIHINISPGTPAMHAVWLILHAGGAFPPGTRLWSSQYNKNTNRTRMTEITFSITTYLKELREQKRREPEIAQYDAEPDSISRQMFMKKLLMFSMVPNSPLFLLGERGTGKTRIVESIIGKTKNINKIVTVPCGGLDNSMIESTLFGHKKGAFTGADSEREGLLKQAAGGILFLDEVQDLPKTAQRKLVRLLQDPKHRFRPVGADKEEDVLFELVCASNKTDVELKELLDPDFYDRISHLKLTVPPLRECREDLKKDWENVWNEICTDERFRLEVPWNHQLEYALSENSLLGNMRDLQKLAFLILVWLISGEKHETAICNALNDWEPSLSSESKEVEIDYSKTREVLLNSFKKKIAEGAKEKYGTWKAAADILGCGEKTLMNDSKL